VEGLGGAVAVLDGVEVGSDFIREGLGDGFALLEVEFVVVEVQVDLPDVCLFFVQQGQFVGAVAHFRYL
jgi:hypothetical protein